MFVMNATLHTRTKKQQQNAKTGAESIIAAILRLQSTQLNFDDVKFKYAGLQTTPFQKRKQ